MENLVAINNNHIRLLQQISEINETFLRSWNSIKPDIESFYEMRFSGPKSQCAHSIFHSNACIMREINRLNHRTEHIEFPSMIL